MNARLEKSSEEADLINTKAVLLCTQAILLTYCMPSRLLELFDQLKELSSKAPDASKFITLKYAVKAIVSNYDYKNTRMSHQLEEYIVKRLFNEAKMLNEKLVNQFGYSKFEKHFELYPIANCMSEISVPRIDFQIRIMLNKYKGTWWELLYMD